MAVDARLNAGEALWEAGNLAGAAAAFEDVLSRDPENFLAMTCLAGVRAQQGKLGAALEAARGAVRLEPNDSAPHRVLGAIYLEKKRWYEAELHMREAVRLEPNEPDNRVALAALYDSRHKRPEAEAEFEAASALSPNDPDVMAAYARFKSSRGDKDGAEALAAEALRIAPNSAAAHLAAGEIAMKAWRLKSAREHALIALSQDADNREATALLVMVKLRTNPIMGVWLVWGLFMDRLGSVWTRLAVVVAIYIAWQVFARTLLVGAPALVQNVTVGLWLGFCVLTWVGPSILKGMIKRELKQVALRRDF